MAKTIKLYDNIQDLSRGLGVCLNNVMDDHRREDGSYSISVGDESGNYQYTLHVPPGKIVKLVYTKDESQIS